MPVPVVPRPTATRFTRSCGAFLALLVLLAGGGAASELVSAASVELLDQQGRPSSVVAHRDHVAVVMVVTASRLRGLRAWQRELQERFESVRYVLVADVPADPPVTYERVVEKLVDRIPDEVSVLIDIDRRWASELDLDTARPNLLLFDRQGRLISRFRGREDPALLESVSRALEELLRR